MASAREYRHVHTGLYLITPPMSDPVHMVGALTRALEGADVDAVLLRFANIRLGEVRRCIDALRSPIRQRHAAVLLDGFAELAHDVHADGSHLTGVEALRSGIGLLKPALIAGAGGLSTRHDAMIAGESGSDYVMFGEPDEVGKRAVFPAILDRVAWWAELFEPPCIGYAASLAEVTPLAAAGADFVALSGSTWVNDPAVAIEAFVEAVQAGDRRQ